jgi:hypothetical protein
VGEKNSIQQDEELFHQQIGREFKKKISEVLHLERSSNAETLTLRK